MTATAPAASRAESYIAFLLEQIGEGNRDAEHELWVHLSSGIRFFLSRQVGPDRAEELAEDVFRGLIDAIRGGDLCDPGGIPALVRREVQRAAAGEPHVSIGADAFAAHEILRWLPQNEREALLRYYHDGHPVGRICRELHMTAAQFRALKERVRIQFKNF